MFGYKLFYAIFAYVPDPESGRKPFRSETAGRTADRSFLTVTGRRAFRKAPFYRHTKSILPMKRFFDFSVRRFGASCRRLQRQRHRRSRTARGAGARYQTSGGGRSVAPFGFARRRNVVVRIRGRKSGRGRGYRRFDDRCVGAFVRLLRFRPDRLLVRSERGRGTHRQRRVDL